MRDQNLCNVPFHRLFLSSIYLVFCILYLSVSSIPYLVGCHSSKIFFFISYPTLFWMSAFGIPAENTEGWYRYSVLCFSRANSISMRVGIDITLLALTDKPSAVRRAHHVFIAPQWKEKMLYPEVRREITTICLLLAVSGRRHLSISTSPTLCHCAA